MTAVSSSRSAVTRLLFGRGLLLTLAAVFALDGLTGLVIIGYGNSYLLDVLDAPSSYPAYALGVYGFVKLLVSPPGGFLLDRLRTATVVVLGGTACGAGLVVIVATESANGYLAGVALLSLGSALCWLDLFHVLGGRHDASERGAATASVGFASILATGTGLAAAAVIAETEHWRLPFAIAAVCSLIAVVCLLNVRVPAPSSASAVPAPERPAAPDQAPQRRVVAATVVFAHFATVAALLAAMVPLVLRTLDLSLLQAGFALGPAGVAGVAGMLLIGARARAGARLRAAGLLYGVAAAAILLIAGAPGPLVLAAGATPLGLSLGAAQPIVNASLIDAARAEVRSGVALGYLFFAEGLGSIVGPALAGAVISAWGERAGVGAAAAFALLLAIVALAQSARVRI